MRRNFADFSRTLFYYKPEEAEKLWQEYLRSNTLMGALFQDNEIFGSARRGNGMTLIHITSSIEEIEKNGFLFASGGCLGASVYATPLNHDQTLHNLAEFLVDYEVPNSLKAQNRPLKEPAILAIRIPQRFFNGKEWQNSGFDYLTIGQTQTKIFKQIAELGVFSEEDYFKIKEKIIQQIQKTRPLLDISANYNLEKTSTESFLGLFLRCLEEMPFLGYIYFEVLLEYVSLFQNDRKSISYKEKGELNNWNFKKMVFEICPHLFSGFKLVNFRPSFKQVSNYLKRKSLNNEIIPGFIENDFLEFMKWRLAQYIRLKLLGGESLPSNLDFEKLLKNDSTIVGHLFHKIVREIPGLSQQYFLYEELKAEVIWNMWNKLDIVCPFNSIVPKGEIGINPRYPDLEYEIYLVKRGSRKIVFEREVKVRLAPKLINPGLTLMRAPNRLPFNI